MCTALCASPALVLNHSPAYAQEGAAIPAGQGGSGEKINEDEYAKDSTTEINVKNADIAAIVRIFSRKTKRNFILDEKVRGKVSIYLPGKVSAEESLRILDSVLTLKGFSAVPIGDNLWKIVPSKEARQSTIPTLTEDRPERAGSAVVTRLVNLKYVNSQDVQQIVAQLISPDGLVNAYTGTNSLILIDSEDNIERLIRIIDELDVPYSNRDMTIIPLKYADVEDVAQKLGSILGLSDSKKDGGSPSDAFRASMGDPTNGGGGNIPPGSAVPVRAGGSGKTVAAKGLEPKIIPDKRTNSIIVVADDDTTARVRALVSQLDSKVDLSGNKFYVYRCQHANAEELAQVLAGLAGGGSGGSMGGASGGGLGSGRSSLGSGGSGLGGGSSGDGSSGTGRSSSFGSSRRNGGGMGSSSSSSGSRSSGGGGGSQGPMTAQLGEDLSITADPATNSLIIAASKSDYEKIRSLLTQIDVKRRQALVEATLLEVSIDNSLRTSASFLTSTGGADGGALARSDFASDAGSLNTLFTNPSKLQGLTLAAASAGSLKLPGGLIIPTQSILLSAAQQNNNVNVLSAPTILATDNEEAQIVVGNNVPFLASTSTNATNLNNTFNQVDRQDVGITLRITPQISSRDYVTLKIYTEVSDLVLSTINSSLGPTTTKRQSETTVISKDGQMIVTGGLIADAVSETDEGVPFLKDIPILGQAFKANSQARVQKNLLIFLTPRIIKDQFDARDVTIEGRDKLDDVIAQYDVEPRRQQTLKSANIDNVAEALQYEGTKPGTIVAPKVINPSSDLRMDLTPKDSNAVVLDGSREGVLDLSASSSVQELIPSNGEPKAALNLNALSPSVAADTLNDRYVVLEFANPSDSQKGVPFLLGASGNSAGVIVPRDTSLSARQFFQTGRRYVYSYNDQKIELVARGVFTSIPLAQAAYPGVSSAWYTLSPYEIMNLGKSPWSRK
jgi:general secretion pathway protein D